VETSQYKTTNRPATVQKPAASLKTVQRKAVTVRNPVQLQTSMQVSSPKDPAEKEADATAKKIMRMAVPESSISYVKTEKGGVFRQVKQEEKDKKVQPKLQSPYITRFADSGAFTQRKPEDTIHRKAEGQPNIASNVSADIQNSMASGSPLPLSVRRFMEPRFQANFSNVKIQTGDKAAKLNRQLNAQAFTVGNQIFFGKDKFQPEHQEGKELIAHELTHTIQQGAAIQRSENVNVTQQAPVQVQRLGLSDVLDYFADKANMIPGFRMFTIVLGVNPINMSSVDRSAANILRAIVEFIPGGGLITKALDNHGVFEKVGTWVEQQIKSLGIIGSAIKQAITQFVDSLSWKDIFDLGGVWERAKRIFTDPIDRLIDFGKGLITGILKFIRDAILKPLAAIAQGTQGYDLLKAILGKDPITGEPVPRNPETLIGGFMKLIGQQEIWENIKKGNAIARAWQWFQTAMAGLMSFVQAIPGKIIDTITSLTIQDIVTVAGAFTKVVGVFVNIATDFISWGLNTIWNLLEIVFDVVKPGLMGYIKKTGPALKNILKNPMPFLGNLVKAAKLGFTNFADNIGNHLKAGVIDWLTGSLTGVYIPKALNLMELGKFALSILGITWAQIRGKIVKVLGPNGETIMKDLETRFDIVVALVTGGMAAAWELIKEKLTNLPDMVIGGIVDFVTDTIVKKAIPKIIGMFIPGVGFISAIISIYDTVMVFVQKISKIIQVVTAFIDSIVAIAGGAIGAAAKRVEGVLAGLLSLAISFLAGFLGLGKVTDKIMGVMEKVRATVDKAIDGAIAWIVGKAKALFAKLFGKKDGKDDRTDEQKKADLDRGLSEGDAALLAVSELDINQFNKRLLTIKNKYKLSQLELVIDSESGDEETVHLVGEVNPKAKKPKHTVKKGGPDSIISKKDLGLDSRPDFRHSTQKQLRILHITQGGSKNIFKDKKGAFKSGTKWHRRHVVSWGDIKGHFLEIFNEKKVRDAAAIIASEGYSGKLNRIDVVKYIRKKAFDAFNDEKNLFIDLGKENSSLQDVLDDAHPDFLDEKGRTVEEKIDEKIQAFIASHAIGGYTFKVKTKNLGVVDWDVTFV
jgi:hypothetical protein